MTDKNWTYALNQDPISQDTLKHQAQSFLYQLKEVLKEAGWTCKQSCATGDKRTNFPVALAYHTATLMPDGRILVIGGTTGTNVDTTYFGTINVTSRVLSWVEGTALPTVLASHTATLMFDGRMLLTGGTAPQYDSTTYFGTIAAGSNVIDWVEGTDLPVALAYHTATRIPDGRVLLSGGSMGEYRDVSTTYFGTIAVGSNVISWVEGTDLPLTLIHHQATLIPDGRVLLTGGTWKNTFAGDPLGGVVWTYVSTTYFGTVMEGSNVIDWVEGTDLPVTLAYHTATLMPDGRILLVGGITVKYALTANVGEGKYQLTTYVGTVITGSTVDWVESVVLPNAIAYHAAVATEYSVVLIGGYNDLYLSNIYHIVGALGVYSIGSVLGLSNSQDRWKNLSDIDWNSAQALRSYVLLTSPIGFIAGVDGDYLGEQSQMSICIECVAATIDVYSTVNLTIYESTPVITYDGDIPLGGQSVALMGTGFIPPLLLPAKFHFATTEKGGFWAGITQSGLGTMSTLITFVDLADVQNHGTKPYPYACHFGFTYNQVNNLTYNSFDQVANPFCKGFNYDGTAGTPRALVLCNPTGAAQIPGTGTTADSGDINGNLLDTYIQIYNATAGKQAMVGRLPDFLATGVTLAVNGSITPPLTATTQSIIDQIWLPANTGLQV